MRHQNVRGETAVCGDPEMMVRRTHVLFARAASCAPAAADPGIDRSMPAYGCAFRLVTHRFDDARDLMPKRKRQYTIFGDIELFVAGQREVAVLDMQIRVAHSAACHADENLAAAGDRTFRHGL